MGMVEKLERQRRRENRANREKKNMAFKYQQIHDYALVLGLHDMGFGKERIARAFANRANYLERFIDNFDAGAEYGLYKLKEECKRVLGDDVNFVNGKEDVK